jgi:hypothetical protein
MYLIDTFLDQEIETVRHIAFKGDIAQNHASLVMHLQYEVNPGADIEIIFKLPKSMTNNEAMIV